MRPKPAFALMIALTALIGIQLSISAADSAQPDRVPAPEFTHTAEEEWINSTPLTLADLHGNVVLIDFWTFDCWNCYRSFPWLIAMEQRLHPQGVRIIGVHTPEFEHERIRANIVAKMNEFGLHHPVMIDNDLSYWRAMANRYWPAFYLLDKRGDIRGVFYGETHAGDQQAERIERLITTLLEE